MAFKWVFTVFSLGILFYLSSCTPEKKVTGATPPQLPPGQGLETSKVDPNPVPTTPVTPGEPNSPNTTSTQPPTSEVKVETVQPLTPPPVVTYGPVTPQEPELFPSANTPIPSPKPFQSVPTAQTPKPFREAMLHGREFLLEKVDYLRPVFPRDYNLGRLQGYLSDTRDFSQGVQTAQEFLTGLMTGKTPEDLILAKWRLTIKTTLEDAFREKLIPKGFRLGILRTMEGGLMANVSLIGTPGTARGQIYLDRDDKGVWKISDLQINMNEMRLAPPKSDILYAPGTYPFLEGI